jgi:hypothetical protein
MKSLAATIFAFCLAIIVNGQPTFHKLVYLEFPVERFTAVLPTDSCYYVTGTFTDSISPVRTGVLLGKIDLQGELVGIKTLKHPDMLFFNDFADLLVNQQGNLFTVGVVNDEPYSIKSTLYIYTHEGDTVKTFDYRSPLYPDDNHVWAKEILQRENGDYVMFNIHWALTPNNDDDNDLSLLAIDSSFEIEFYQTYATSTLDEVAESLIVDTDGGYVLGAKRTNHGEVLLNFTSRTLIIKTDSEGEEQWQWLSPAGVLRDEAKAMIRTPDGGLVVASGIGQEIGNNPNGHTLVWDVMIFKLDANQNVVWSTPFRGDLPNGYTELTEMVEATDGNGYVASGIVSEKVGTELAYPTSWLVKVSPDGDSLWSRRYTWYNGEFIAPQVWDMKATPDGGYVLVGYAPELFDIVTNPFIPAWIMKVDQYGCLIPGCHLTDATEESGQAMPQLAIYPNPTSDLLNFQLRSAAPTARGSFRIVDANGRLVQEINGASPQATVIVPVREWAAGVYFLQYLEDGEVRVVERFVKQ